MPVTHPDQEFEAFLRDGRLMIQRTAPDGPAVFYPRLASPGSGEPLDWFEASGRGVVYATTTVRPRDREPYNVSLIDLAEGPRMMSRVQGVPSEDVRIGWEVRAKIVEQEGLPLVVFVPEVAG